MISNISRWLSGSPRARMIRRPRIGLQRLEAREVPAAFTVSNLNDSGAGSLRQAITSANGAAGLDTITFTAGANGIIVLASTLTISDSVIITGNGVGSTIVNGNSAVRIFDIAGAGTLDVSLSGMTLTKGKFTTGSGAAVQNSGENLTITNCVLTGNTAGTAGAIFVNGGKLNLSDSTISANSAFGFGGGIYFNGGATVAITNCTISGNSSSNSGGGVSSNGGTLTVTNSVVTGNSAANGGGIDAYQINFTLQSTTVSNNAVGGNGGGILITSGTTTVTASTVSGNKALEGGGIFMTGSVGTADIRNVTVANNTATGGGGVFFQSVTGTVNLTNSTISGNAANGTTGGGLLIYLGSPTVNLESSVISGNTGPFGKDFARYAGTLNVTKCAFEFTSNTFTDKGSNIVGPHANLKLGALAINGGPVQTFRPQTGSPLIGAGSNPGSLTADARGVSRSIGTTDIGAVEVATAIVVTTTADAGAGSLRQAILDSNLDTDAGAATASTIGFDTAGAFKSAATITLTTGELIVGDSITINGPGFDKLTLDGSNASRIFNTSSAANGTSITLAGMTLTKGSTSGDGGAIFVGEEVLTIISCVIINNTAGGDGGGINVESSSSTTLARLVLDGSTVSGNTAASAGGGIYFFDSGSFLIRNSTVSGNRALGSTGGGLYFYGSATAGGTVIAQSTFSGNSAAGSGGAVVLLGSSGAGTLQVHSSTIVDNTGSTGGGIARTSGAFAIDVQSSIISGNSGTNHDISSSGTVTAKFSAIGSNTGFTFTDQGNNLPFQPHANLKLGPIISTGAASGFFHAPGIESPLVDAGSNPSSFGSDIRGDFRTIGIQPDIGNVEIRNFVVINTNNTGGGSLRQAVQHGFSNDFNSTITFDGSVHGKTITLATEIAIGDAVTINGPGANLVTISGGGVGRIFNTSSAAASTVINISGLSLTGGKTTSVGGAIAIESENVTVTNCALFGNSAGGNGGAISAELVGALVIVGCTINGNTSADDGGGISTYGTLTVINSTISGNSAINGGGILTFNASSTIRNSTMVDNKATILGGGICRQGTGTITVESSIVSGNTSPAGPDLLTAATVLANFSAIGSKAGVNTFIGDTTTNALLGQNFKLGSLANNGGSTRTILPAPDSPLVDAGSNLASLTLDQRGDQRVIGTAADIGAVEVLNLIVLNTSNAGPGSLRQTIEHANSVAGADFVTFSPAVFATPQTIKLASQIAISDSTAIQGPGTDKATVSGNGVTRIFATTAAAAGTAISFSGLTLTQGVFSGGSGGAIVMGDESVAITNCVLSGNSAFLGGGAIAIYSGASTGTLTVSATTISGNTAGSGSAINIYSPTILTVVNSTISANKATDSTGGGIRFGNATGTVTILNSTISGNSALTTGGGIVLSGSFAGTFNVRNSTITNNTAAAGGGVGRFTGSAACSFTSTIISGNSAGTGPDVSTSGTASFTDCLLGSSAGITTPVFSGTTAGLLGKAANLGPLTNNGGPTQTHALLPGSAAIGQGSNPAPALTTDQRGRPRVVGNIDIGSFELQPGAKITGLVVGDGTVQRSMVNQIKISFDSPVSFVGNPASAFTLTRQKDAASVPLAAAVSGNDVTLTFTGGAIDNKSLADGRYTLNILANQIGADGLDGNGDGTSGDNFTLVGDPTNGLFRLFGDADGNGTVNPADFLAFRLAFLSSSPVFDFDGDGTVGPGDFLAFRLNFLKVI